MEKINTSVTSFVGQVLQRISSEYGIPEDDLRACVHEMIASRKRVQCNGTCGQNNEQCTVLSRPGKEYCQRHLFKNSSTPSSKSEPSSSQCIGVVANGSRCMRHSRKDSEYCGIHKFQQHVLGDNNSPKFPCIFFQELDERKVFCDEIAISGELLCKKHRHLQSVYANLHGCSDLEEYIGRPVQNNVVLNEIVQKRLKK